MTLYRFETHMLFQWHQIRSFISTILWNYLQNNHSVHCGFLKQNIQFKTKILLRYINRSSVLLLHFSLKVFVLYGYYYIIYMLMRLDTALSTIFQLVVLGTDCIDLGTYHLLKYLDKLVLKLKVTITMAMFTSGLTYIVIWNGSICFIWLLLHYIYADETGYGTFNNISVSGVRDWLHR
jgi:hypothetical protein